MINGMKQAQKLNDYICNKFYILEFKDGDGNEYFTRGVLLDYANGNVKLFAEEGLYCVRYDNILLMKPAKNVFLESCSKEYRELVQPYLPTKE